MKFVLPTVLLLASCAWSNDTFSFVSFAHKIATKEMSAEDWKKFVTAAEEGLAVESRSDDSLSLQRYLDDRLKNRAAAARKAEIAALKEFVYWLALYQEFDLTPPDYAAQLKESERTELAKLLENFSWEKASVSLKKAIEDRKGK